MVTQLGMASELLELPPSLSLRLFCESAEVADCYIAKRYAGHLTSLQVLEIDLGGALLLSPIEFVTQYGAIEQLLEGLRAD